LCTYAVNEDGADKFFSPLFKNFWICHWLYGLGAASQWGLGWRRSQNWIWCTPNRTSYVASWTEFYENQFLKILPPERLKIAPSIPMRFFLYAFCSVHHDHDGHAWSDVKMRRQMMLRWRCWAVNSRSWKRLPSPNFVAGDYSFLKCAQNHNDKTTPACGIGLCITRINYAHVMQMYHLSEARKGAGTSWYSTPDCRSVGGAWLYSIGACELALFSASTRTKTRNWNVRTKTKNRVFVSSLFGW